MMHSESVRRPTELLLALLLWLGWNTSPALSQSIWEVTPYSARVWWVFGDEPHLPETWKAEFGSQLDRSLSVIFRAALDVTVEPAPESMRPTLQRRLHQLSAAEVYAASPELRNQDKLYLVSIVGQRQGYRIQVREFDCYLAHFGPTDEAEVDMLAQVPGRTAQMITNAFSPVVRIDRFSDGRATTRLRAGALLRGPQAIGRLQVGDVLLPFDRRASTSGKTTSKDIRPIDWTYLLVTNEATVTPIDSLEVVSGYKQPLRSKRNRRRQQVALRTRPTANESTIRLQTRTTTPKPLIGYEIHEQGTNGTSVFLGYTDWRGELTISATRRPIRTLLVRSGDRVIAKLPIVPGLRRDVVASMADNRQRVETDGFLSGIQTSLVDLVARRESLTSRIRRLISSGEVAEAETLLQQFRNLPTQADFRREIQQQQRDLNVTESRLRKRIDTMFVDTYRILGKYLDADRLRQLESELAVAKSQ